MGEQWSTEPACMPFPERPVESTDKPLAYVTVPTPMAPAEVWLEHGSTPSTGSLVPKELFTSAMPGPAVDFEDSIDGFSKGAPSGLGMELTNLLSTGGPS